MSLHSWQLPKITCESGESVKLKSIIQQINIIYLTNLLVQFFVVPILQNQLNKIGPVMAQMGQLIYHFFTSQANISVHVLM